MKNKKSIIELIAIHKWLTYRFISAPMLSNLQWTLKNIRIVQNKIEELEKAIGRWT